MKMSVNEIYTRFGEPFYRALETMKIKEFAQMEQKHVISVGAGLPLQEQNQKHLKELGTVVYLQGSAQTLAERLENNPNFRGGDNLQEKLKKLLASRDPVYRKMADVEVTTGVKPFEDLVDEIEKKLENCEKTVEKNQ